MITKYGHEAWRIHFMTKRGSQTFESVILSL